MWKAPPSAHGSKHRKRNGARINHLKVLRWELARRPLTEPRDGTKVALTDLLGSLYQRLGDDPRDVEAVPPAALGRALGLPLSEKMRIEDERTEYMQRKGWKPPSWLCRLSSILACDMSSVEEQAAVYKRRGRKAANARRKAKRQAQHEGKQMEKTYATSGESYRAFMAARSALARARREVLIEELGEAEHSVTELMDRLRRSRHPTWRELAGDKVRLRRAVLDDLDALEEEGRIASRHDRRARGFSERVVWKADRKQQPASAAKPQPERWASVPATAGGTVDDENPF
jgi:hypothetical protein